MCVSAKSMDVSRVVSSAVVSTLAYHAAGPVQFPDLEARITRCKNLALYIRDCVSLCLSDETLKSRWSLLSGVYARGSKRSHTGVNV